MFVWTCKYKAPINRRENATEEALESWNSNCQAILLKILVVPVEY